MVTTHPSPPAPKFPFMLNKPWYSQAGILSPANL